MSTNNCATSIATTDAAQCLDADADSFNFLSIGSNNHLHLFVRSLINNCVKSNTNNNKKEGKGENGNLPEQIKTATINFIRQQCPNFHQSPNSNTRNVVASILKAGQDIAASIDENGTPQTKQFNVAVKSIFKSIRAIFPQRAMFNLMCRWSRQLKLHFQRDAINVLAVLSHQLNMDLPTFLLTARCWRILPMSTNGGKARRQRARITYVKNDEKANNIINHLHTAVELLNFDIISEEQLYMSSHRMNSVNRSKKFNILEQKINNENDEMETETTDGLVDGEDALNVDQLANLVTEYPEKEDDAAIGKFFVKVNPLQGYHLTSSFVQRLWLTIQHLHSGLIIYKCIFATALFKHEKYTFLKDVDTKCLAYLLYTTSDCGQRSAFVHLLSQLCFIFPNYERIAAGQDIIQRLVLSETPNAFMENLQSLSGQSHGLKKSTILAVFESMNNLGTQKPFMVNKNHFRGKVLENQYNVVVATVFHHHLKFAAQRELRVELFNLGHKLKDKSTTKKAPTSITTKTSGTKRKQSCAEEIATSYVDLSSQLTTCSVVTDDFSTVPDIESATLLTLPINDNIDHDDHNYNYKQLSHITNWSNHCLCPMSYLRRHVRTALVVSHEECVYQLWSSNFEVYSAGMLRLNRHRRITMPPTKINDLETATFVIPEKDPFHIDRNDVLHVYRNESPQMNRHVKNLQCNISLIARVIMQYGVVDSNRKSSVGRIINFGVAAEYGQTTTTTIQVKGQHFFKNIPTKDKEEFFYSILSIGQLIWKCVRSQQVEASKPPLATDNNRDSKFASVLRKYMINQAGAGAHFNDPWEWYTLSIMLLFPCFGSCKDHQDKKNCLLYAYSKTGCANFIINDNMGKIYLLQILVNFRTSIESFFMPYHNHVACIISNIKLYLHKLKQEYQHRIGDQYKGEDRPMGFLENAADQNDFFLDEHMPYKSFDIGQDIYLDLLKLPIGVDRTMSLSSVICAILSHGEWLRYDQAVELCLMASLLNNTARFYYIISAMRKESLSAVADNDRSTHPLYFYMRKSMELFHNWQGGADARYSVSGMLHKDVESFFKATSSLKKVVKILIDFIAWIDSLQGKSEAKEIPIPSILAQFETTIKAVKEAGGGGKWEFGLFRIQIFMTIANGIGLTKPGEHLLQLMIPASPKQASYTHLLKVKENQLSNRTWGKICSRELTNINATSTPADMPPQYFDIAMRCISEGLGIMKYHRAPIEGKSCEAHHGRITMTKYEVYVKGSSIHTLSKYGGPMFKNYGTYTWIPLQMWKREYLYTKL